MNWSRPKNVYCFNSLTLTLKFICILDTHASGLWGVSSLYNRWNISGGFELRTSISQTCPSLIDCPKQRVINIVYIVYISQSFYSHLNALRRCYHEALLEYSIHMLSGISPLGIFLFKWIFSFSWGQKPFIIGANLANSCHCSLCP